MKLLEKIRCNRKLKGWSQEDIAAKLEMSSNGYGSIERGDTDVNLSRLNSIAELFDMTLLELMSFDLNSIPSTTPSVINHHWNNQKYSRSYMVNENDFTDAQV